MITLNLLFTFLILEFKYILELRKVNEEFHSIFHQRRDFLNNSNKIFIYLYIYIIHIHFKPFYK